MKIPLFALFVIGPFCVPAHAENSRAELPTRLEIPAGSGVMIPAQIELVSLVGGQWKMPAPQAEELSDTGFRVSYTAEQGGRLNFKVGWEKEDSQWKAVAGWSSPSPAPETFILLSLIFPVSAVQAARMTSGDAVVDISKILANESTRTSLPGVTQFTLNGWEGKDISFLFTANVEAQAIVLGDNFHLRVFLTPRKEALAENGEIGWTVRPE